MNQHWMAPIAEAKPPAGKRETSSPWTEENVEKLKSMWAGGSTGTEIALAIPGTTRGGIMGKIDRLGLPARRKKSPKLRTRGRKIGVDGALASRIVHRFNERPAAKAKRVDKPSKVRVCGQVETPPQALDTAFMCQIHDLTDRSCRYPLWQADTPSTDRFYCGVPTASFNAGHVYCAFHSRVAYQSPQQPGMERAG